MERFSFQNFKHLFHVYESYISSFFLVAGFIFDYLTLTRVDFFWDNIFIISYLVIVGIGIVVVNAYEEGKMRGGFVENVYEVIPFLMQFSFGGLFSAFTVFYSKSASLLSSGIFVLVLFGLLVGNEFFKERYQKLVFQMSLYFVALFSFFIFFVPVLLKQMGALVFLGSGGVSLMCIGIFIFGLSKISPMRYANDRSLLIVAILVLFTSINFLYFTNLIPPIPLSLKTGDVFHSVVRTTIGNYLATGETDSPWYKSFSAKVIHVRSGESAYVFTSVFAPTALNTKVIHNWQYFDESKDEWVDSGRVTFSIVGGRDNGYRGFSRKDSILPGKWRVSIETERGQILGRVRFDVEQVSTLVTLETKTL